MKQLFRRLQRRRQHRRESASVVTPKLEPSFVPIPEVIANYDDATTVSRYTMDSRGHFVQNNDMDEAILQVAVSAIEMATRMPVTGENAKEEDEHCSVSYHENQATVAVEEAKWETAIFHYEHALYYMEDSKTWDTEILGTISTILNNLAYAHQICKSDQRKILHLYGAALTIKRYVYGKLHESTAKTLNNLGSTHYIYRQFHDAAMYYEEARDILRLLPNAKVLSSEIATISSNLGDVHYCLKQYERANFEYRSSLRLRWNLYDKEHPKITRLLEQIASTEQKNHDDGDDDASSVSSCRSNDSWHQEIQQLQTELSVDLEFLDSLEASVPIQMAKDKATVFRELRHLTASDTVHRVQGNGEKSSSTKPSSTKPTLKEVPQKTCYVVSPDSSCEVLNQRPEHESIVSESSLQGSGDWTVFAKNQSSSVVGTAIPIDDDFKKQMSVDTALTAKTETPPATPQRLRPITSPKLTPNQRQAALTDVKTRLAQLRASRMSSNSGNDSSRACV